MKIKDVRINSLMTRMNIVTDNEEASRKVGTEDGSNKIKSDESFEIHHSKAIIELQCQWTFQMLINALYNRVMCG